MASQIQVPSQTHAREEKAVVAKSGARLEDDDSNPSTEFGSDVDQSDAEGAESDCDCSLEPFTAEDTILILDWDDTVLPTTWIEEQGLTIDDSCFVSVEQQAALDRLAARVRRTLAVAKSYGTVVLVTNAEHGWVELSCRKFLPSLLPCLEDLKILSARSAYEWRGVARPADWKFFAFQHEISEFCGLPSSFGRRKNVISIGDSVHEREALIRATEPIPNSCMKALKFTERPRIEQLLKEHEFVSECLGDIVEHDGSLDVRIGV